jgi:hypothetical protein
MPLPLALFELDAVLPSPSEDAPSERASSLSVVERGSSRVSEDEWEGESVSEAGGDGLEGLEGVRIGAMTEGGSCAGVDDGRAKPFVSLLRAVSTCSHQCETRYRLKDISIT